MLKFSLRNLPRLKKVQGNVKIERTGKGVIFLDGPYKGRYIEEIIEELDDGTGSGHLTIQVGLRQ